MFKKKKPLKKKPLENNYVKEDVITEHNGKDIRRKEERREGSLFHYIVL